MKTDCPMQNKWFTPQVVYEAEVTKSTGEELKIYYGLTKTIFKEKHQNHKTLNNRDSMEDIQLSKYIWSLKDQNKTPHLKLSIVKKVNSRAKLNYCN